MDILLVILVLIFFSGVMQGVFVLHEKGEIDYVKKPLLSVGYFVVPVVLLLYFIYFNTSLLSPLGTKAWITLVLFVLFMLLLPFVLQKAFVLRGKSFLRSGLRGVPFTYGYIIAKSSELFFQQLCIALIVFFSLEVFEQSFFFIILFAIVFGLIHSYLILYLGRGYGVVFMGASAFVGLLFPLVLLHEAMVLYTPLLCIGSFIQACFLYIKKSG